MIEALKKARALIKRELQDDPDIYQLRRYDRLEAIAAIDAALAQPQDDAAELAERLIEAAIDSDASGRPDAALYQLAVDLRAALAQAVDVNQAANGSRQSILSAQDSRQGELAQTDAPCEREAFEAWAAKQPRYDGVSMRFLALHNSYVDYELHGGWSAWQARAASAPAAPGWQPIDSEGVKS